MNGITTEFVRIEPLPAFPLYNMVVKDWTPQSAGTSGDSAFPYNIVRTLEPGGRFRGMVPAPTNQIFGDLKSEVMLAGQGSAPPSEKLFTAHFIVKINDASVAPFTQPGPYFDPSYGAFYTSVADFEEQSNLGIRD